MHLYALSDADFSIAKKASDDFDSSSLGATSRARTAATSAGKDPMAYAGEDPVHEPEGVYREAVGPTINA